MSLKKSSNIVSDIKAPKLIISGKLNLHPPNPSKSGTGRQTINCQIKKKLYLILVALFKF
jgi:hypothetical protein